MARRRKTTRRVVRRPRPPSNLDYPAPDDQIDVQFEFDGAKGDYDDMDEWEFAGASRFPDKFRIPRSEWDDRIREHEKHKSSADFYSDHFTHQGRSHECVCHAASQVFLCTYNRQVGTKWAVWMSPLSLYTRLTGGRQWGGSNVHHSLRVMMSEGFLPEHDGPAWLGGDGGQAKRFKHTLHQSSGRTESHWPTKGWIRPGSFPDGWKDTARHFRMIEAYTIPDREAHASALLHGWALSNGRNGHSIPHMVLVKRDGRYLSKYRDSYDVWRYDSERLWGGGFCGRVCTFPDDVSKPAGEDMRQ